MIGVVWVAKLSVKNLRRRELCKNHLVLVTGTNL